MWRDEFDAVFFFELLVQGVGVISSVADEAGREFVKEASGEGFFDELAFMGRSALYTDGVRKAVISGDSDDLCPLAAACRTDRKTPFFALANVASMKASRRLSLPSCRCLASKPSAFSSLPFCTHC